MIRRSSSHSTREHSRRSGVGCCSGCFLRYVLRCICFKGAFGADGCVDVVSTVGLVLCKASVSYCSLQVKRPLF